MTGHPLVKRGLAALAFALTACGGAGPTEPSGPVSSGGPVNAADSIPPDLWRPPAGATPTDGSSYLYVESDPGDPVGQGTTHLWVQHDPWQTSGVEVTASRFGQHFGTSMLDDPLMVHGDLSGPDSMPDLPLGYYGGLTRWGSHDPAVGGLGWRIDGRECSTLTGWFALENLVVLGDQLEAIDYRFEQQCVGSAGALRGQVHWVRSSPAPLPPPPIDPPPTSLWRPSPGATPASGNYVYLESEPGDRLGQGETWLLTAGEIVFDVSAAGRTLTVLGDGMDGVRADFQGMSTIPVLLPGYYAAIRPDGASPSLRVSFAGNACNGYEGWFVVDDIRWSGEMLVAIDLRFQQRCLSNVPPQPTAVLHGQIHWDASDHTGELAPVNPPPAGLWDAPAGATPATGSYVYVETAPTSPVGGATVELYTLANSLIGVNPLDGGRVQVNVLGDSSRSGEFGPMQTVSRLEPGYYGALRSNASSDPARGGLSWAPLCNDYGGVPRRQGERWFVVDRITWSGSTVTALDLRFGRTCPASDLPAIHGKIHWENEVPPPPSAPTAAPPGLWNASPGATPSSGNYVYLTSALGDPIGLGQTWLYTSANATLTVTRTDLVGDAERLEVVISGSDRSWRGTILPPYRSSPLQAGYYAPIARSTGNPVVPRMDWTGGARACGEVAGWFMIDAITRSPTGAIQSIDLRFDQRCDGGTPDLLGKVHWQAN